MPTVPITLEARRKAMGELFRRARKGQGLTVIQVAVKAGVAQKVVEAVEHGGSVTVTSLLLVASVVGVQVDVTAVNMEATP